ncbi:POTRA domain-containing protein [Ekhidna sp.]|uniref:POTRA domain-containing protein n=1 Tax=Ekhidna sp. TaxID=2608089 RepID=UPI003B5029F9
MKGLSFVILFLFSIDCYSQQIESVSFEGLSKTKESFVEQFLTISKGDQLDSSILYLNKQRLANLEMFADVDFKVNRLNKGVEVIFECEEVYTLLPIFSFGGIEENFWIQVGASEVNLGGRGNKITTYYQYYDRSSYAAHLTFDRIKKSNWGVNINLIKWSTLEPLFFDSNTVEYEYDNYTLGLDVIRHLNFTDRLLVGGALFTEDYRKFTEGSFAGAPDELSKLKMLGKAILIHNRINYHYYYLDGWHNQINLESVYSFDDDPNFYIMFNDVKRFIAMGLRGNLAARIRLGLSSNHDSPFAPFVLDSYLNIRGIGNRVDRGTGAIILNAEYRHAFIDKNKIAVQGVIFSDSGSWRNPGGDFSDFSDDENFVLFAGGGFRFIHKKIYNAILRVDYGFNLQEPSINGFVLGIGQYF